MSHRSTKAPCTADRGGRRGGPAESQSPRPLMQKRLATEMERESELLAALTIARRELGEDHPLVKAALRSLKAKERKRRGTPDGITALISSTAQNHRREHALARMLTPILDEYPVHESYLPGFGRCRVDLYFVRNKLVVEDNDRSHKREDRQVRDARLREVCVVTGLKLLEFDYREPLTEDHLRERLARLGIAG